MQCVRSLHFRSAGRKSADDGGVASPVPHAGHEIGVGRERVGEPERASSSVAGHDEAIAPLKRIASEEGCRHADLGYRMYLNLASRRVPQIEAVEHGRAVEVHPRMEGEVAFSERGKRLDSAAMRRQHEDAAPAAHVVKKSGSVRSVST